jgi:hypothetical protein
MVRVSPFIAVLAGVSSMVQAMPAQVMIEKRAEAGEYTNIKIDFV